MANKASERDIFPTLLTLRYLRKRVPVPYITDARDIRLTGKFPFPDIQPAKSVPVPVSDAENNP